MIRFIPDVSIRKTNNNLVMLYHKIEGTLFELNETASEIVNIINEGVNSVDEIVDKLLTIYDATKEELLLEVKSFVDEFEEYKLLINE